MKAAESVLLALAITVTFANLPTATAEENYLLVTVESAQARKNVSALSAKVAIDAPPAIVWQNITNYSNLKNVLPGYEKSTIVKNGGGSKVLELATRVARFLPTYKYQVKVQENRQDYRINLNRISGDFKTMNASYRLVPQEGGKKTLLIYDLNIDPGTHIPGSQMILKNHTEKSLEALERYIEDQYRKSVVGQHSP